MPRIEESRQLPVSLQEGFDYITNVANWHEYWPSLIEIPAAEQLVWEKPGDRARVVLEVRGRPTEMAMELDEFRPYELVEYRSTQEGLPPMRHGRYFRDRDGRLDYSIVIEFQPRGGLHGLVDRLIVSRIVRKNLVTTLDNLERIFRERRT